VLCVILVGKGVSALQEAGWLPVSSLAGFIRVEALGLYPNIQTIAAQAATAALLLIGFWHNQRLSTGRK
jgi:high-affinity iron transporter